MQKENLTILFPVTFLIYLFAPIILWAGITDNSFGLTIEEKNAMLITGIVIFSIVIILCAIAAIIIITYSNIDKKWKLILSFS